MSVTWSVNDFRPCISEYNGAVRQHWSKIIQLAFILGTNACDTILTMSVNERQWSVNGSWSWIFNTLRAIECSKPAINPPAAFIGKNTSDDIASTFSSWAPTAHQHFLHRLSKLHSNGVHCAVPKLCFTRSVFAISPYIQLHKYACNVSQIWFFGF